MLNPEKQGIEIIHFHEYNKENFSKALKNFCWAEAPLGAK